MAGNALPLIVGLGAAAFILSKKPKKASKTAQPAVEDESIKVVKSGSTRGWSWRVRQIPGAVLFIGEIQAPDSDEWVKVHQDGKANSEQARLLALEAIFKNLADKNVDEEQGGPIIASAGEVAGWEWRVRKVPASPGAPEAFFGEVRAADSDEWISVHTDGREDPEEARLLALEHIYAAAEEQG